MRYISIVLMASACLGYGLREQAEAACRKYANELGYPTEAKISCVSNDSDADHYVSCSIRVLGEPIEQVECYVPYGLVLLPNEGCRAAKTMRSTP